MISGTFRVLFFGILSLAGGWGGVLLFGSSADSVSTEEQRRFNAAYPGERVECSLASAEPLESHLGYPGFFIPFLTKRGGMSRFSSIVERRLWVASAFLPLLLLALAAGWLLGMVLRERIRFGISYASPLVSFVSRRTAEVALVYFILWSFTPLGLPLWSLYATLPPIFLGSLGYLANLPTRV